MTFDGRLRVFLAQVQMDVAKLQAELKLGSQDV